MCFGLLSFEERRGDLPLSDGASDGVNKRWTEQAMEQTRDNGTQTMASKRWSEQATMHVAKWLVGVNSILFRHQTSSRFAKRHKSVARFTLLQRYSWTSSTPTPFQRSPEGSGCFQNRSAKKMADVKLCRKLSNLPLSHSEWESRAILKKALKVAP